MTGKSPEQALPSGVTSSSEEVGKLDCRLHTVGTCGPTLAAMVPSLSLLNTAHARPPTHRFTPSVMTSHENSTAQTEPWQLVFTIAPPAWYVVVPRIRSTVQV